MIIMLLARNGIPEHVTRWQISLARAYAYIHAARVLDGEDMIWPQAKQQDGLVQQRARQRYERYEANQ